MSYNTIGQGDRRTGDERKLVNYMLLPLSRLSIDHDRVMHNLSHFAGVVNGIACYS